MYSASTSRSFLDFEPVEITHEIVVKFMHFAPQNVTRNKTQGETNAVKVHVFVAHECFEHLPAEVRVSLTLLVLL
jgi:hypothetical protein